MTQADMACDAEIRIAFPTVDPGATPLGSRVLVQFRAPKKKSKGGIILVDDTVETEKWNTQVGRVVALGPLAFKSRDKMSDWPEGAWAKVGDFVRASKYGGDRWEVADESGEPVLFAIFNDLDLIAKVTGNPLAMKAFI